MSDVELLSRKYRLQPTQGRSIAFWGVILLAMTEGVLFVVLLFSWFYTWARASQWPPAGVELPELAWTGVRSAALFATSGSVWLAERALRRGDRGRVWLWTVATVVGAGFFLVTHIREFVLTTPDEFLWSDHAYGSLWWTILNFHGAHVAVGILIWLFVLVRLGRGAYGTDDTTEFETASIYWHFVDGVWVAVLLSLYLVPNLVGG